MNIAADDWSPHVGGWDSFSLDTPPLAVLVALRFRAVSERGDGPVTRFVSPSCSLEIPTGAGMLSVCGPGAPGLIAVLTRLPPHISSLSDSDRLVRGSFPCGPAPRPEDWEPAREGILLALHQGPVFWEEAWQGGRWSEACTAAAELACLPSLDRGRWFAAAVSAWRRSGESCDEVMAGLLAAELAWLVPCRHPAAPMGWQALLSLGERSSGCWSYADDLARTHGLSMDPPPPSGAWLALREGPALVGGAVDWSV